LTAPDWRLADNLRYGAYVLKDSEGAPDILLIATGSEVPLALEASKYY